VRSRLLVPAVLAVAALATVLVGNVLDQSGTVLGSPHPPFISKWDPRTHPLLVVSVLLMAGSVPLAPRLLHLRLAPLGFAVAVFAFTLVLRLALAFGRDGTGVWGRVFDLTRSGEARNEYLAGLPALQYGRGFFLDHFAELVPALPVHVAGHPPGLLVAADLFGFTTPGALGAVCVIAGALSAPLTYAIGRGLLDERGARAAALLMALAPSVLLHGVTSGDALFLTLGLLAAWPLVSLRRGVRVAGALALALVSFFAWSLLAVAAWAALVALQRDGWRRALELAVLCGVAVLGFYAAVAALAGFDPIGTLQATEAVYRVGVADIRPYWFWLLGSPVAFLLALGLPIAWLAARELGEGSPLARAIFGVLLVAAVMGFTKAETERIWLFFAPFVCLAAAPLLTDRRVMPVAALLAVQAVATEALFGSPW